MPILSPALVRDSALNDNMNTVQKLANLHIKNMKHRENKILV